jgi:glyceraldehyde 3-phosphate dehydrogenase
MTIRVGINGFGRIGRQVLKAIHETYSSQIEVVAFNDLGDLNTMAHLFRYDSNYGKYDGTGEVQDSTLVVDGHAIKALG